MFFKFSADHAVVGFQLISGLDSFFSKRDSVYLVCNESRITSGKKKHFFKNLTEALLLTLAKSVYYNEK